MFLFCSICVLIHCSKEAHCCSTSFLLIKNSATCLVLIKWATKRVRFGVFVYIVSKLQLFSLTGWTIVQVWGHPEVFLTFVRGDFVKKYFSTHAGFALWKDFSPWNLLQFKISEYIIRYTDGFLARSQKPRWLMIVLECMISPFQNPNMEGYVPVLFCSHYSCVVICKRNTSLPV